MRFGGYIRVSSVGNRDRDTFLSPQLQLDRIQQWCDAHGHDLADIREDLDVSGGARDRPNLAALVDKIETGQLDGIVVARLDRFARNIVNAVMLMERIDQAGGQFVSVADGFDTRTTYGRLALNILLSIAQFELERYREGWHESRAKMIEQGRHYGPTVPLGYERGIDGVLVPSLTAPLIREAFRRRAAGESPTILARWLASQGVRTGRGGEPGDRYMRELLANPVYKGQARAGELVNDQAHEPLVSSDIWERAQAARGPQPARADDPPAYSGLIRCGACRYVMGAAKSPTRQGVRRAYRCRGKHASGDCPAPAFALEEHLRPLIETRFFTEVEEMQKVATEDTDAIADLTGARDRARQAFVLFRDDPDIIEAVGPADYADGLRGRRERLAEAERALAVEVSRRPDGLPSSAMLRETWPEIDVHTRKRMLAQVFGAVVVRKPTVHRSHTEPLEGRVSFLLADEMPADMPRPGRLPVPLRPFDI